ncbi:MAG: alpha-galactosidase [Ruminococcaceae bacterium]|nr:alpha-galactosidase [Oscillospiraceae bacterium]
MQKLLKHADFADIYFDQAKMTFSYRFGTAVYEEVFDGHRLYSAGWNGAGYTLNVLEDMPSRLRLGERLNTAAFRLEAGGCTLEYDWAYESFVKEETENGLHGILTLKSTLLPLTVLVHTLLDGTGVMERYLELVNEDSAPISVGEIALLSGGVEEGTNDWDPFFDPHSADHLYSLGSFESAEWGCEGLFKWTDLPSAGLTVNGKWANNRYRHPAFFLKNNLYGSLFFGQLAYTGSFDFTFRKDTEPNKKGCNSRLSWDLAITGPKPMLVLGAGERYVTPSMHVGLLIGDLDDAVNEMHRHLRRSVLRHTDVGGIKGLIECGMGPERTMDVAACKHFIDTAAEVGAEVFLIDAGWYAPKGLATTEWSKRQGDWQVSPDLYPNGIGEVRDYAHQKGLKFGMWMEPEAIGPLSRVAEEHPEWLTVSLTAHGTKKQLDLTNPEAAAWAEAEIVRVIEENKLDAFRLDHNNHIDTWHGRGEQNGRSACQLNRHLDAVYGIYRRVRERFPDLVMENCASGGSRTDVGMLEPFTHTWVSDWNEAPRSVAITNGMTMVLPPETVDRLISGMFCHTRGSLDLQVRHALFGRPSTNDYNCVGSKPNPAQLAFVKHSFDLYKSFVRPMAGKDLIFHHTPEVNGTQPQGVCVLERAAEDGSRSMLGVFNLCMAGAREERIFPRGIDAGARYRVTADNSGAACEVDGFTLCNEGLRVRLDGALQSELLLLERI